MKATGIVRKVDKNGRFVVPKSIRDEQGLNDKIEIFVEKDGEVILRECSLRCSFCGLENSDDMIEFKGSNICNNCLKEIHKIEINNK